MRKIKSILLLTILLPIILNAQKSSETTYTLEECIKIGLAQNLDIIRAKAVIASSQANLKAAFGSYLPNIQFSMGYNRQLNTQGGQSVNVGGQVINIGATSLNSYNMGINAGLNLFDGFNREATYNSAEDTYQGNLLSYDQSKVLLKINIYRRFFDYASKKQIVQTRKENLDQGQQELASIKAQSEAGTLPISAVYSKEADLGSLELDLAKAENDLNISRANLLALMGKNPIEKADFSTADINTDVGENDFTNFRNHIGDFDAAINFAFKNRKDFLSQLKNISAAQNTVMSAQSAYFPSLALGTGWSWSNTAFDDFNNKGRSYIGLSLNVPIFTGFSTNAAVQQAEYSFQIQQVQKSDMELSIKTEIETAFLNLDAAEKQIKISEKALFSADLNYKILKERFNVGTASITDLIQANTQFLNAKINKINSVFYYLLTQKEIEYSTGMLN